MISKRNSALPRVSPYRWIFLLTILLIFVALLPVGQRAERQSRQGLGPQRQLSASGEKTKKERLDAVPGDILVRFRPGSKGRQLGRQVVTEKTGRQIPLSVESAGSASEIVEGLRIVRESILTTRAKRLQLCVRVRTWSTLSRTSFAKRSSRPTIPATRKCGNSTIRAKPPPTAEPPAPPATTSAPSKVETSPPAAATS